MDELSSTIKKMEHKICDKLNHVLQPVPEPPSRAVSEAPSLCLPTQFYNAFRLGSPQYMQPSAGPSHASPAPTTFPTPAAVQPLLDTATPAADDILSIASVMPALLQPLILEELYMYHHHQ